MPRPVRPLSQWSIIADLRRDVDRLRLRSPSQQVVFTHDTFTAAGTPSTTYPLTYLPTDGSVLLAKQGLVLREGTDYTVDGTTGIVTVTASQTAGDQIVFRYATTGELIANNATVETDAPTFVAVSSVAANLWSGTTPLSAPAGLQVGDLMISAFAFTTSAGASTGTLTGWTRLDVASTTGGAQNEQADIHWKVAASGDVGASYTRTASSNWGTWGIIAYRGASSSTPPFVRTLTTADSTSFTGPAASATTDPSVLLTVLASESNVVAAPVQTPGAGPTVRLNTHGNAFTALSLLEDSQSAPGAGVGRSATVTDTSSWAGYQITLAPA